MGVLRTLLVGGRRMLAAVSSKLAPAPLPKLKPKQKSFPSYLTNTQTTDTVIPLRDRRLAGLNIENYRAGTSTRQVIRDFAAASPDLSAAVNAYLRTAITNTYTAVARNMDGTFNRDGTELVQQLLVRFDILGNYDDGFSGVSSMRSNSDRLPKS